MRKELLIIALGLFLTAGTAAAEVLTVPEGEPAPEITLPAKGITMADVTRKYGEPRVKRPTVGGGSPKQPPITRWDYDGFSVIFERDRVVDAVIPGAPPKVYNKDELQPATAQVPVPGTLSVIPAPATSGPEAPTATTEPAPAAVAPEATQEAASMPDAEAAFPEPGAEAAAPEAGMEALPPEEGTEARAPEAGAESTFPEPGAEATAPEPGPEATEPTPQ
jgi:hypothetical protein